jgi:hypothetical protein
MIGDDVRHVIFCECGRRAEFDGYCPRCRMDRRASTERKVGGVFLAFVLVVVISLILLGIL